MSSSSRSNPPDSSLPAGQRARKDVKGAVRLEQHSLHTPKDAEAGSRTTRPSTRPLSGTEQRDPRELHGGLDIQILSDSAYDRLFPNGETGGTP